MTNQESSNKPNHKQDIKDSSISSSNIQQGQTGEGGNLTNIQGSKNTVIHNNIYQSIPKLSNSKHLNPRKLSLIDLFVMIVASVVISGAVMGIRYLGVLQGLELQAFDLLMQLRPSDGKDSRILLVTIDEQDIEYQDKMKMKRNGSVSSLSDQALAKLLNKLEKLDPRIIGLDIYHEVPFGSVLPAQLKDDGQFFVICKAPSPDEGSKGVPPPKDISPDFQGFSDVVKDSDGIIRRHLLTMSPHISHSCSTGYSFSFLIAMHYLYAVKGINAQLTSEKEWKFGDLVLRKLTPHTSGYQRLDAQGSQLLLNYRSYPSLQNVAHRVSLRDILERGINAELVNQQKDWIILIGTIAKGENYDDFWNTPYGQEIPGVFLQAQMISQIISAVLDDRPLLWWWSGWIEAVWVGVWSVAGGILTLCFRQRIYLVLTVGLVIGVAICVICFFILTKAGWVPLVPPVFSLLGTQIVVVWWTKCSSSFRNSEKY